MSVETLDPAAELAPTIEPELTIDLPHPAEFKGKTYSSLVLRQPFVMQVRQAEAKLRPGASGDCLRDYQYALVSSVSKVPEGALDGVPISLLNRANRYLSDWIDWGEIPPDELMRREVDLETLDPELTIEFDPPISVLNREHSFLQLSEPTSFMVKRAELHLKGRVGAEGLRKYEISLVAQAAGVNPIVIEALPITVHNRAKRYLQNFIQAGRRIGAS